MKFRQPTPRRPRFHLTGSLDGPSRTITVEPVEIPATAPPPEVRPERVLPMVDAALAAVTGALAHHRGARIRS